MIPSQPLLIGDIISETFKMSWKTLKRVVPIALLLSALSIFIVVWAVTGVLERGYETLEQNYPLDSASVSEFRTGILNELRDENPFLLYLYFPDLVTAELQQLPHISDTAKSDSLYSDSTYRSNHTVVDILVARDFQGEVEEFIEKNFDQFSEMLNILLLTILAALFISLFLNTFIIDICVRSFEERRLNISAGLLSTIRRNVWMSILMYLWMIFILLFGLGIMIAIAAFFPSGIEVLLLFSSLAFLLLFGIRLAFAQVALVSEELGPLDSLHRSWGLTKGYFWQTLGRLIVLFLIFIVVQSISQSLIGIFGFSNTDSLQGFINGEHTNVNNVFQDLISVLYSYSMEYLIITVLFITFMPSLLTVMYYDLRTRKDGPLTYPEDTHSSIA